jgi:hypothetical protein
MRVWAVFELERRSTAWRAAASVVVGLCLLLVQSLLYLPNGTGIESFLGELGCNGAEQRHAWEVSYRLPFAVLYLGADTLLFVPVYAAFALGLSRAVRAHSMGSLQPSPWWRALQAPLLVLVLVDLAENALGLSRLGVPGMVAAVVVTLASARLLWGLPELRAVALATRWLGPSLLGLAALAVLCGVLWDLEVPAGGVFIRLAVGAHEAKRACAPLAFGALALASLAWLFGVDRLLARAFGVLETEQMHEAARERVSLRGAIWDLLGRSRYVILTLTVIAGLVAGMDQARDVLYAIAASPFRDRSGSVCGKAALGMFAALVALAFSTCGLEYTCWFWTRSIGQILPARLDEGKSAREKRNAGAVWQAPRMPITPERALAHVQRLADGFAKYWARALAFVPIVLFVVLHARVVRDGVMSGADGLPPRMAPVFTVLVFGVLLLALGVWLLWRHCDSKYSQAGCYYSAIGWQAWAERIGLFPEQGQKPSRKYLVLFGKLRVYWLPLLLGAGMLSCRLVDVFPSHWLPWQADYVPSMSLAVVQCSLALWLSLLGWLSLLETRQSIPWLGLVLALVGGLGLIGLTDNHIVWPALAADHGLPGAAFEERALFRLLAFTALFLVLLLSAYALAVSIARRHSRKQPTACFALGGAAALVGLGVFALYSANTWATSRPPAPIRLARSSCERRSLDEALARWLKTFCHDGASCPSHADVPVYFVSTEGGGIRAAAWTAFALDALAADPQFLMRTFAISGVSGGAVGAAAFRACSVERGVLLDSDTRARCLEHFAATDQLSPLLSAWMFEDVLARVLPTSPCSVPGCGVLSRGAWFEQALELGAPGLRRGLVETSSEGTAALHVPYLLLNATWVESGDRAIASDLMVDEALFPGARDQLTLMGTDLSLATAAHNAARFPFINPIGSLHANQSACAPSSTATGVASLSQRCGHLADGGYFDNSGAQSTLDVVRGLAACLGEPGDSDSAAYPKCRALSAEQRHWFRQHLIPQILMIRSDVELTRSGANYAPDRPLEPAPSKLFTDALGPVLTLFHVSGIGAGRRLAEARQLDAVRALRQRWPESSCSPEPAVRTIDLLPDGTLYPLGWHLSHAAIEGMLGQAACLVSGGVLAGTL